MADITKLAKVADIDFTSTFEVKTSKLVEMLNTFEPIPAKAGETLKQYEITGSVTSAAYTEGADIPVTTYTTNEVQSFEVELKPYRVSTTLQEVQKRGYERAVADKDQKLSGDIQGILKGDIITSLETGTGSATGDTFLKCAANAWAVLQNAAEEHNFGDVAPIFFANPIDFAKNVGDSEVFSSFGMQYIQNFAGLGNLISTAKVPEGTIYCTAAQNMKVYYVPANEAPGFDFTTDESGYIAVQHDTTLKNLSYDTVAWTALTFFAEYVNLVIKGTIAAG